MDAPKGWQGALGAVLKALGAAFAERLEEQLRASALEALKQTSMDGRRATARRFREAIAEGPFALPADVAQGLERDLAAALLSGSPDDFLARLEVVQKDAGWNLLQRLAFLQTVTANEGVAVQLGGGRIELRAGAPEPAPGRPKLRLLQGGAGSDPEPEDPEAPVPTDA